MKSKLIFEHQGERTFALVFEAGDEVVAGLRAFAKETNLTAARFTAIGAFSDVTLGFFDPDRKEYERTVLREQVEVLSLLGNVAVHEGKPVVHAHVVVGKRDGTAHGGHLLEASTAFQQGETISKQYSFGKVGYGGPSPPASKPHRYFFKLFALDRPLDLQPGATKDQLLAAARGHVLGEAELMGTYGR